MDVLALPLRLARLALLGLGVGLAWLALAAARDLLQLLDEASYHREVAELLAAAGFHAAAARRYALADAATGEDPAGGPADFDSCCNAGHCAQAAGDHAGAARHYQRALRRQPGHHGLHRALGLSFHRLGRPADALHHLERALWRDPEDPQLRRLAARSAAALGDVERAGQHLQRVVREHPETRDAYLCQARLHLLHRDAAGALRTALRAAALAPADMEVRLAVAEAYAQGGRLPDAVRHFREVLRRLPDHVEARVGLVQALLAADAAAALSAVDAGLRACPQEPALLCAKGEVLAVLGDVPGARACLESARAAQPEHAQVRRLASRLPAPAPPPGAVPPS